MTASDTSDKRKGPRQTVVLKGSLNAGKHTFDILAYDLSLKGVRVKFDLPLEVGADVNIKIKDKPYVSSRVAWSRDGFVGLEFNLSPAEVKRVFGTLGAKLT